LEETLVERRGRNNRQNSDELKGQRSDRQRPGIRTAEAIKILEQAERFERTEE
jgi:hypothetical protein